MTWTVSIGDFRNNLADYLDKIKQGHTIVLKDEKRGEEVAEILPKKKFDQKKYARTYMKTLKKIGQVFSAKDHPEWSTPEKIVAWVNKSRQESERNFDDLPRL